MRGSVASWLLYTTVAATLPAPSDAARPADVVYRNGKIYTANARNAVCQASALHAQDLPPALAELFTKGSAAEKAGQLDASLSSRVS